CWSRDGWWRRGGRRCRSRWLSGTSCDVLERIALILLGGRERRDVLHVPHLETARIAGEPIRWVLASDAGPPEVDFECDQVGIGRRHEDVHPLLSAPGVHEFVAVAVE